MLKHYDLPNHEAIIEKKIKFVLYAGKNKEMVARKLRPLGYEVIGFRSFEKLKNYLFNLQGLEVEAVISDYHVKGKLYHHLIAAVKKHLYFNDLPFILLAELKNENANLGALSKGVDDVYNYDFEGKDLIDRINFLKDFKSLLKQRKINQNHEVISMKAADKVFKRLLDVFVSSSLLIIFSPLMLLIAVLIKIESRGPVFYISKRAGSGYKIFDFYKFRTMRVGADKELQKLLHLNQYSSSSFVKIQNDPRITRLGQFLRNTSLDELPQLINVLKGDMSLVGNRPLPLYEAKLLTVDGAAKRFSGPAGITGLWQVTKRGKSDMSEQERIDLDVQYAQKASFIYDLGLIFKTIPAMVQKAKV